MTKVGFIGLSHLGAVSSISIASHTSGAFEVLGYDSRHDIIDALNAGKPSIHEPELNRLLSETLRKTIRFTKNAEDLKSCDIVYFALDVKTNADNTSDLAPLTELIEQTIPHLSTQSTIVLLSQVPPGYTRKLAHKIKQTLYYQVETLIFGRAVERATQPERYIIGCNDPEVSLPEAYQKILNAYGCPILKMRYESAELAKISINLCLVSSISVANTLAEVCEKIGAEWSEIASALKLDRRIGQYAYLSPGLGIAGGNLERDLLTVCQLAQEHGTDSRVVEAWIANNKYRLEWVLRILRNEVFSQKSNPTLGVWGLAYKQDTHSTKNSPSLATIENLKMIPIKAYDPQVILTSDQKHSKLAQVNSAMEACTGVEVLLLMTPWKEFSTQDLSSVRKAMSGNVIIDPYGVLDNKKCKELGFKYFKLGSALTV